VLDVLQFNFRKYKVYTVAYHKVIMRYLSFLLFLYSLVSLAYAGPQDKWVYVGQQFDGIALLLAIGAFVWVYLIYRDFKVKRARGK